MGKKEVEIQDSPAAEAGPEQIRSQLIAELESLSAGQLKERCPKLFRAIADSVAGASQANLRVDGFLLDLGDPFGDGALRAFKKLSGVDGARIPYVLPYKDPHTKTAIENYILRASGAGDTVRVEAARRAMTRCK